MNIFIGVLGSNYERYLDLAKELFWRERASIICELHERPWLWPFLDSTPTGTPGDTYLLYAHRTDLAVDDQRSVRTAVQEMVRKQSATIMDRLKEQSAQIEAKIEKLAAEI